MKNTSVLGVPLSMINRQQLLSVIEETIQLHRRISIVAINARKIVRIHRNPEMKRLIMGFDVFLADGSSVVKAADSAVERITGIDLMEDICRCSREIGARIFFYGASEKNNLAAQKKLKELYPDVQILPLDYDPDVSFANIENRLQMLVMNVNQQKEEAS